MGELLDVMKELPGGHDEVVVTHEMGFAREVGNRVLLWQTQAVERVPPKHFRQSEIPG